jgi:cell division protein FtsW
MRFARIDQSPVARWWWTVDRWRLGAMMRLIAVGAALSLAASRPVAPRIGYA